MLLAPCLLSFRRPLMMYVAASWQIMAPFVPFAPGVPREGRRTRQDGLAVNGDLQLAC